MATREHKIKKGLRSEVYAITGSKCWYCGDPATTIDHGQPLSFHGSKKKHNLYPCCEWCNQTKDDKTVEEYRQWFLQPGNNNHILEAGKFWGEVNQKFVPLPEDKDRITRTWLNSPLAGCSPLMLRLPWDSE